MFSLNCRLKVVKCGKEDFRRIQLKKKKTQKCVEEKNQSKSRHGGGLL